jgi:hypothetical protein
MEAALWTPPIWDWTYKL